MSIFYLSVPPPIVFTLAEIVSATSSIDTPRSTIRIGTPSSTIFQTRTRSIDEDTGTLPTIRPRNVKESHALPVYIIYVSVGASAAVVVLVAATVTVINVSVCLKKGKKKHVNTTDNVAYHDSNGQETMESNKAYQYTTTDPATTVTSVSANIAYNVIRREGPHEYDIIGSDLTVDTTPAYQAIADVQSTLQDEEYAYAYESVPATAETDMGITTTPNEAYATTSAPQHESISEN